MSARGPRYRCPDCNGRPQGMLIQHRPGCPLLTSLTREARADAAHLGAAGAVHYYRELTHSERTELGWLRPDVDPDDYRMFVGLLDSETRVRAFIPRDQADA